MCAMRRCAAGLRSAPRRERSRALRYPVPLNEGRPRLCPPRSRARRLPQPRGDLHGCGTRTSASPWVSDGEKGKTASAGRGAPPGGLTQVWGRCARHGGAGRRLEVEGPGWVRIGAGVARGWGPQGRRGGLRGLAPGVPWPPGSH